MESSNAIQKQGAGKLVILGIQHMFAMFGATVLVPLITGLNPAVALFAAGIGTWIFHLITGRKVPVFLGSSFAFMGAIVAVTQMYSNGAEVGTAAYTAALPYATGGILAAGALYLVLALLVKIFGADTIRSFFPPVVTGPVIITIGLMLAPVAISGISTGLEVNGSMIPLWINWVVALATILSIVLVSIFVKGFFKLVPILIGIVVGYIAALIAGIIDFEPIQKAAWIAVPEFFLPKFDMKAILLIAPIALAVMTAVPAIGLILVIALLTIPAYLAEMTARSLGAMMATAALWALAFSLSGLALAYAFDLTSGAVIVAVAVLTLALAEGLRFAYRRLRKTPTKSTPR